MNQELFKSYVDMISEGNGARFLEKMPPQALQKELDNLCHAALLAPDVEQGHTFLEKLMEYAFREQLPKKRLAVLRVASKRAENVYQAGGWLPIVQGQERKQPAPLPFPEDVFPPMLELYGDSVAANVQVDPAMIKTAMLGACALTMQGKYQITYPSGNGHREHLCLYLVIVGNPGERKSSCFSLALLPVTRWQHSQREYYNDLLTKYRVKQKIAQREIDGIEKQLAGQNLTDKKRGELGDKLTALELSRSQCKPPISPEILATDTTVEALFKLMERTGETAGIFSEEADSLKIVAGLYNGGTVGNLELLLKAYDGSGCSRIRSSDNQSQYLHEPVLSVCLFSQPSLYEDTFNNAEMRGRGLIGRMVVCFPAQKAGTRNVRNKSRIDPEALRAYCELLGTFVDKPRPEPGSMPVIQWTPEAAEVMLDYLQELENSMQKGRAMEQATDYTSKAGGVAQRFTGVLHMLWTQDPQKPVTLDTAQRAIRLHRYYFRQKQVAMEQEEAQEQALAARVMEKVLNMTKGTCKAYISERELHQRLRHTKHLEKRSGLRDMLELLEARHLLQIVEERGKSAVIFLNPNYTP